VIEENRRKTMSEVAVVENNGTPRDKQYYARAISPPVDVFENADEVLVVADLPGVPAGSIDVRVENDTVVLAAKRTSESEVDFARRFRIPPGIDAGGICAEAKNGTILIRFPKVAAVKPRKIVVRPA
jgi:HSP20 family protein